MINLPNRKAIRLTDYNYSTPGAYFITVCVDGRKPILWNVGAAISRPFSLLMVLRAADCRPYVGRGLRAADCRPYVGRGLRAAGCRPYIKVHNQ